MATLLLVGGCTRNQIEWGILRDHLDEHAQDLQYALRAGDAGIERDARANIRADCQQATRLKHGSTHEEQSVRQACQALGFPLP